MSQVTASPLLALIEYYERLPGIADFGFRPQDISFCLVLERDGRLFDVQYLGTDEEGKRRGRSITVPYWKTRTSGEWPNFLWDHTEYVLGLDAGAGPERANHRFGMFRDLHNTLKQGVEDPALAAICMFLESWHPGRLPELRYPDEIIGTNVVFKLRGADHLSFVHDSPSLQRLWVQRINAEITTQVGISLINGEEDDIVDAHPLIRGVAGTKSNKGAIVSFNDDKPAFASYAKQGNFNAPMGIRDAFRYTTALNHLLADPTRRMLIGDATVVFWAGRPEAKDAEDLFAAIFGEQLPKGEAAESGKTVDRVRHFLEAARQGRLVDKIADPEAPFCILGLSPNKSRISVRYWLTGTVRQFAQRLAEHAADLEIAGAPVDRPPPMIRTLLSETARDEKDVPPQLAGEVARAILQGLPYPEALVNAVIRRIRADGVIGWRRAAILKACLNREGRYTVVVYLNKEHPAKAYHCGRLLAVLEFAQEQALGDVNAGIIRRNLGSVMATPGVMLGRLQRAAELGHVSKLRKTMPKVAGFIQDELKAINVMLRDSVPTQLDLRQQTVFALGLYQQRQYLDFVSKQIQQERRIRTSQGEWVRSGLEARTADALARAGFACIYESSAMLPGAGERWPDFVIRRGSPHDDLYVEVLGMDTSEYNDRWEKKLAGYAAFGVTPAGGPKGHLVVLDFRRERFDDAKVFDALRQYMTNPGNANN